MFKQVGILSIGDFSKRRRKCKEASKAVASVVSKGLQHFPSLPHLDVVTRENAMSLSDLASPECSVRNTSRTAQEEREHSPPVVVTVRLLQHRNDIALFKA